MHKRLQWLDTAKGIGIFSIVLGHVAFKEIGYILFLYHVPLFFWIAGYTLKKESDIFKFSAQKFKRLMIPYMITCICVLLMDIINNILLFNNRDILNIIKINLQVSLIASGSRMDVLGHDIGRMAGAIWFLPALFFSLIIMQLIKKIENRNIQFAIAIILYVIAWYSAKIIWLPFSIQPAIMAILFLVLGNWQKDNTIFYQKPILLIVYPFFMLFGFYISLLKGDVVISIVRCHSLSILTPVIVFCSMMFILMISMKMSNISWINYYGRNSLVGLCVHLFLLNTFSPWITRISGNKYFYAFMQIILFMILTPIISSLPKIKCLLKA